MKAMAPLNPATIREEHNYITMGKTWNCVNMKLRSQYFEFKCKFNSILIQANINVVDCISMNKWQ